MQHVAICASGPSLAVSDCDLISAAGIPLIAVNSSWRAAMKCRFIYAGDLSWWDKSISSISVDAEKWSCNTQAARRHGLNLFETDTSGTFNSGQRAILFAASLGVKNIILIGYDCSIANGLHWHGPHVAMDNPTTDCVERWKGEFRRTADDLAGKVHIVNCSRRTSLNCFRKAPLEETLLELSKN
ncbi:hypothetical protein MXF20_15445 [Pantoea dispersa]|uniref:hypothetical protein n=1 Tax=Pantoea dispersa TaxID=59814 RepID=UPI002DBF1D9A|nr:hypothetical protein [Pantoea dispersa]MEB5973473.1 hypothetical protein [Pantoea dispersa]